MMLIAARYITEEQFSGLLQILWNLDEGMVNTVAWYPCLSKSKHRAVCMGNVGLDLIMLYAICNHMSYYYAMLSHTNSVKYWKCC